MKTADALIVILVAFAACAAAASFPRHSNRLEELQTSQSLASQYPLLGTTTSSLQSTDEFSLSVFKGDGWTRAVTNLTTVGGILPSLSAYAVHMDAYVIGAINMSSFAGIINVVTPAGKVLVNKNYPVYVFTTMEYDIATKQVFLTGHDMLNRNNYLLELNPKTGDLTQVVVLPGVVQSGISTYCPKGHKYFYTIQSSGKWLNSLCIVDTQAKTISNPVSLDAGVLQLFWDYDTSVLYAVSADQTHAAVLQVIDMSSGKVAKTISNFPELSAGANNGATAVFDIKSKLITGSFVNVTDPGLTPFWVAMDTQSGKTTANAVNFYAINIVQTP